MNFTLLLWFNALIIQPSKTSYAPYTVVRSIITLVYLCSKQQE